MNPRCPQCESRWIGFHIPEGSYVVRVDGSLSKITLASSDGQFLDIDHIDHSRARCLDCGRVFDATPTTDRTGGNHVHA